MDRLTRPCEDTENGKYIPYVVGKYTGIYPYRESETETIMGEVVERLAYYENLEEEGRLIIKSGINVKELYEKVIAHIDSMTNEELLESASRASEMTAGCNDDWPDNLVEVVRCKDCTWFSHGYCKNFNDNVDPNDFCSRGHTET